MSIAIGYSRITGIHNILVSSHLDLFPSTVPSHSMGGVKKSRGRRRYNEQPDNNGCLGKKVGNVPANLPGSFQKGPFQLSVSLVF